MIIPDGMKTRKIHLLVAVVLYPKGKLQDTDEAIICHQKDVKKQIQKEPFFLFYPLILCYQNNESQRKVVSGDITGPTAK